MESNYPLGAENNPEAPYNEIYSTEDMFIETTLSREVPLNVRKFQTEYLQIYKENHFTINDLLDILIKECDNNIKNKKNISYYKKVKKEAESWVEEFFTIEII